MKRKKKKMLTQNQQAFVTAYQRNAGNILATCNELDITTARAAAIMQNPLVKEQLSRSVAEAKHMLETAAPHLVDLAMQMVNNENVSVKVRASLIDSLLDRAGVITPKQPAVQVNINTEISDRARMLLAEKLTNEMNEKVNEEVQ